VGTVTRWLQKWFISDGERVRTDFILDPESVADIDGSRAGKPEKALIEGAGTRQIGRWIHDEGKFDDFSLAMAYTMRCGPTRHKISDRAQ
jgi:hypothetical protein